MDQKIDRANWMKYLDPAQRVIDSYIPASHDGAAYYGGDRIDDAFHAAAGSIAQSASITTQLAVGSRYFDLRVCKKRIAGTIVSDELFMHHGIDYYFASFTQILLEISAWARFHPTEFIFMDIDFDDDINISVQQTLINTIGEDQFTDLHKGADGLYNKALTWGDLQKGGKQFIVIWPAAHPSGKDWAPSANFIRYNWPDNALPTDTGEAIGFDYQTHSATEILAMLDKELQQWQKDLLFVTQIIDTPKLSIIPGHHPADLDEKAAPQWNAFIKKRQKGDPLCIAKRDFANATWTREGFDHVILLNQLTGENAPNIPTLGQPVFFTDYIRFKTLDGHYLYIEKATQPGQLSYLRVREDESYDESSTFIIRNQNFHPKEYVRFNGNIDADYEHGAPDGTCRFVSWPADKPRVENQEVALSVTDAKVYWGIPWGPSGDHESFTLFSKDNLKGNTNVYDQSEVLIKAIWGLAFLKVTPDRYVQAIGNRFSYDGTPFKIEVVREVEPFSDPKTWQLEDPMGPNVNP